MNMNFRSVSTPKFQGIEQQQKYEKELRRFPDETLRRLTEINAQRDFKSHIELSEKYSEIDPNVRAVHEEVSNLVAQKREATDEGVLAKVKEQLNDLRTAIQKVLDQFNGVE